MSHVILSSPEEEGRFTHWNDLSTNPDGLMPRVGEEVAIDGDGFPMEFVCPACIVPGREQDVLKTK